MNNYRLSLEDKIRREVYVRADSPDQAKEKLKTFPNLYDLFWENNADIIVEQRITGVDKVRTYSCHVQGHRWSKSFDVYATSEEEAITLAKKYEKQTLAHNTAEISVMVSSHD